MLFNAFSVFCCGNLRYKLNIVTQCSSSLGFTLDFCITILAVGNLIIGAVLFAVSGNNVLLNGSICNMGKLSIGLVLTGKLCATLGALNNLVIAAFLGAGSCYNILLSGLAGSMRNLIGCLVLTGKLCAALGALNNQVIAAFLGAGSRYNVLLSSLAGSMRNLFGCLVLTGNLFAAICALYNLVIAAFLGAGSRYNILLNRSSGCMNVSGCGLSGRIRKVENSRYSFGSSHLQGNELSVVVVSFVRDVRNGRLVFYAVGIDNLSAFDVLCVVSHVLVVNVKRSGTESLDGLFIPAAVLLNRHFGLLPLEERIVGGVCEILFECIRHGLCLGHGGGEITFQQVVQGGDAALNAVVLVIFPSRAEVLLVGVRGVLSGGYALCYINSVAQAGVVHGDIRGLIGLVGGGVGGGPDYAVTCAIFDGTVC